MPQPQLPAMTNWRFEVDFEIQRALVALHGYSIKIRGAGRFGDGAAGRMGATVCRAVLARHTTTSRQALAVYERAPTPASAPPSTMRYSSRMGLPEK